MQEKTHDELMFEVLEKVKLKQKEMKEKREKDAKYWDNLSYECEKALDYNIGFIDIFIDAKYPSIVEIKTKQEILETINFCGDTLRQLNKYKQALKKNGSHYNIQMRLIVPDKDCLTEEQKTFFYDNCVNLATSDDPLQGI